VTLSPSVAWLIEIRGGVSHWDGDLRTIRSRRSRYGAASATLTCG
jgi:hypothetical protein